MKIAETGLEVEIATTFKAAAKMIVGVMMWVKLLSECKQRVHF